MATEFAWDGEEAVFDLAAGTMQVPGMQSATFVRRPPPPVV